MNTYPCKQCGNNFQSYKFDVEKRNRRFCSHKCLGLFQKGKLRSLEDRKKMSSNHRKVEFITLNCKNCKKDFSIRPCESKGRIYCSLPCVYKSPEYRVKRAKIGSKVCTGRKITVETRKKMSIAKSGSKSILWKGGITPINMRIRQSLEYKLWRKAVFIRDNFTCQDCGAKSGNGKTVFLNADHIKPFSKFPELRFEISNGRTLCRECHFNTPTYGGRAVNYQFI